MKVCSSSICRLVDDEVSTYDFEGGTLAGFTTGGDSDWAVATDLKHSGTYSAKSGSITHSQSTWLKLIKTVPSPGGILKFWVRTSSELNFDFLKFYVNDVLVSSWSGTGAGWFPYIVFISPGAAVEFKWTYEKDDTTSLGDDCVWIDDITLVLGGIVSGYLKSTYSILSDQLITNNIRVGSEIDIIDGVTEPDPLIGYARIYVDVADGNLKIIFPDGVIKTIAEDA